jgi:hypothetical protein
MSVEWLFSTTLLAGERQGDEGLDEGSKRRKHEHPPPAPPEQGRQGRGLRAAAGGGGGGGVSGVSGGTQGKAARGDHERDPSTVAGVNTRPRVSST